jgi:hypothetical protein
MTDLNGQLADMRRDLDVAERTGAELRTKIAAAEAALAASAPLAAPDPAPDVYRIKLVRPVGEFQSTHPVGSILAVAPNDATAAASGAPSLAHAVDLVRLGLAVWDGPAPPGAEHMPVTSVAGSQPFVMRADLAGGPR